MYPDCDRHHLQQVANTPKLEKDLLRLEKRKVRDLIYFHTWGCSNLPPLQKLGQLKVGLLYYTEGQTEEDQIFSNGEVIPYFSPWPN